MEPRYESLWINKREAMNVKVRTKDFRLFLPVPVSLAGWAVRWIPERDFEKMRENTPEPYCALITKESVCMLLRECVGVLRENKGLEMVHVEAQDGTFVSVKL